MLMNYTSEEEAEEEEEEEKEEEEKEEQQAHHGEECVGKLTTPNAGRRMKEREERDGEGEEGGRRKIMRA